MTIDSYRYAFILFLSFMEEKNISADSIEITDLTYQTVLDFLSWLEITRKNAIATRNQRQAALNSFIAFLMYEFPDSLIEFQRVLSIPVSASRKKSLTLRLMALNSFSSRLICTLETVRAIMLC